MTWTDNVQIFGELPFVKQQNDTWATDKRLKTMQHEKETYYYFGGLSCCRLYWEIKYWLNIHHTTVDKNTAYFKIPAAIVILGHAARATSINMSV